jgi:hypothetical protein
VGFVVDKVAQAKFFFEYRGFPCHFLFRQMLHIAHLFYGAGAEDYLRLTPILPHPKNQN